MADNRQPTLQDGNPRDPRSTATIVLPSGQVVQGQPINDRIPIPEGYADQLQVQRDLSSGQRTTAPQADTAEGIAAAQAIINARPETLDTTQVITEPAPQVEFAQENPTGPAQSGPDYERPSEAYLKDLAQQIVTLEAQGKPIPDELREQLSVVAENAETWEAILNEARAQSSGTNASGNYTDASARANELRINEGPGVQEMASAAATEEVAEIDKTMARTQAQRATELEDEARELAQIADPSAQPDRDALEATANATAANQDLEADANFSDAERAGNYAAQDIRNLWAQGRAELAGMNTGADPVYQASKQEYNRLFNEYLERSKINPSRRLGAALQAAGGFRFNIGDRGTMSLDYDTNSLNAANNLSQEEQTMRQAGAKATQDALIRTRQDTDAARIDMLKGQTEALSDAQVSFTQPIINAYAASGQFNEQQQAEAMNAVLAFQNALAASNMDERKQMRIQEFLAADLPLITMGRINEVPEERLRAYASNKELMNIGPLQQALQAAGIVTNGVNAAANVVDAFIPDSVFAEGGSVGDGNPNNENRPDTVPALLSEGEFVIKNSDVKKIRNGMGKEVLQKIVAHYDGPVHQENKPIKKYSRGGDVALGAGGGALSGAATGATIGSAFGPIGTLVGGGIGALGGGIMGGVNANNAHDANLQQKDINRKARTQDIINKTQRPTKNKGTAQPTIWI